jgi:hypothetical protein
MQGRPDSHKEADTTLDRFSGGGLKRGFEEKRAWAEALGVKWDHVLKKDSKSRGATRQGNGSIPGSILETLYIKFFYFLLL